MSLDRTQLEQAITHYMEEREQHILAATQAEGAALALQALLDRLLKEEDPRKEGEPDGSS